jgi:hypothetical protein
VSDRKRLAKNIGCSPLYLYQVGARRINSRTNKPAVLGVALCLAAVKSDPRLTLEELRPDIWGESDEALSNVAGVECE